MNQSAPAAEVPTEHPAAEARTFVVLVTPACLVAWQLGWDLGAFDTIDYRWMWSVWVLSVVALVASVLFRGTQYALGLRWKVILAIPSVRMAVDYFVDVETNLASLLLALASAATLPFALYVLARLLAGDFFTMRRRTRVAAAVTVIAVLIIGAILGAAHPKYLWCEDFRQIGDFVPENCTP